MKEGLSYVYARAIQRPITISVLLVGMLAGYLVTQYRTEIELIRNHQSLQNQIAHLEGIVKEQAYQIESLQERVGGLDREVIGELVPDLTAQEAKIQRMVPVPVWYQNRENELRRRISALEGWRLQTSGRCP